MPHRPEKTKDLKTKSDEIMQERKQNFLKDYEAAVLPLQEKYLIQLVPVIQYTEKGAFPVFALDNYIPKKHETLDSKPETDEGTDSDTQASE